MDATQKEIEIYLQKVLEKQKAIEKQIEASEAHQFFQDWKELEGVLHELEKAKTDYQEQTLLKHKFD